MQNFKLHTLALMSLAFLTACQGSSNHPTKPAIQNLATGVFADARVAGIAIYVDGKKIGVTDKQGQFKYPQGKTVTFKLNKVNLGSFTAPAMITPADLAQNKTALSNILILLQSLDTDVYPDNGITLNLDTIRNLVTPVDLYKKNSSLAPIQKDMGSLTLVSKPKALKHFANLINDGFVPTQAKKDMTKNIIGYWLSDCDKGSIRKITYAKKGTHGYQYVTELRRKYNNNNCTGNFTENVFDAKASAKNMVLGISGHIPNKMVTVSNGTQIHTLIFKGDNTFMDENGVTFTKHKEFPTTDKKTNALNNMVGFWHTHCKDGKKWSFEYSKKDTSSYQLVKTLQRRYKHANCTGAFTEEVSHETDSDTNKNTILSVVNQDSLKKVYISGKNGATTELIFNSDNRFTNTNGLVHTKSDSFAIPMTASEEKANTASIMGKTWISACDNGVIKQVEYDYGDRGVDAYKLISTLTKNYANNDCTGNVSTQQADAGDLPSNKYTITQVEKINSYQKKVTIGLTDGTTKVITLSTDTSFTDGGVAYTELLTGRPAT